MSVVSVCAVGWGLLCSPVYADAEPGEGVCPIVESSQPRAVVVLAENPTRPAQVAAKEFVHYVKRMTGAELSVMVDAVVPKLAWSPRRVLIGESSLTREYGLKNADFAPQEYLVQTRGHDLILMGHDAEEHGLISYEKNGLWPSATKRRHGLDHPCFVPMGSLYAVNTFLEKVGGVRWYLPGEVGEVCPEHRSLVARNLNIRTKPWTRYRWSSRQSYRAPFYFYGSRQPDVLKHVPARDMLLYMLRLKMGGSLFACNHSFASYWDRFGKEHPEWWKEGKPTSAWPHPDYTNADLMRQAADDAISYFSGAFPDGRYPNGSTVMAFGDYFAVMPLDGRKGLIWSEAAEKLRSLDPDEQTGFSCGWASDYVFTVVKQVAEIVGKRFPDKRITCAAYGPYFYPPTRFEKMPPNVAIQQCGFLHDAFDKATWTQNADNLAAWSQRATEVYVWEYYLQQSFAKFRAFPVVFPHQVARAVRHMHECGVKGMFFEASAAPAKSGPYSDATLANPIEDLLNHYVTWKLLCDPDIDIDVLLDEHYRLFYGPAAAPMKAFYERIEATWQAGADAKDASRAAKYWEIMCPPSELPAYRDLIDKAIALAETAPYDMRVRLAADAVYRRMERNSLAYASRQTPRPRVGCPRIPAPAIDGALDDAAWQQAALIDGLRRLTIEASEADTTVRLGRDEKSLYVAFDCTEPYLDRLVAAAPKPDAPELARDDHVLVFIDVGRSRAKYARLAVNAAGLVQDVAVDAEAKKTDAAWQADATVKAARHATGWSVEMAVPFDALGATPKPGDVWGVNVMRLRRAGVDDPNGQASWWALPPTEFHTPDEFGVMILADADVVQGEPEPVVALEFEEPITGPGQRVDTGAGLRLDGQAVKAEASLSRGDWTPASRGDGRIGHAYAFTKKGKGYVNVTLPESLGLARDDFTVTLWCRTSDPGDNTLVFSTTSSPLWGLSLGEFKAQRVAQFLIGAPAPSTGLRVEAPPADGQWHHVALVVDRGKQAQLYVDGQLRGGTDIRRHRGPLKNLFTVGGPYFPFEGAIDAVRVYKGTLTGERIRAIVAGP